MLCLILLTTYFLFKARKSDGQKRKEKEESDESFVRFYFNLYLEKNGVDRKMLNDER